jgi:hypothetical protein
VQSVIHKFEGLLKDQEEKFNLKLNGLAAEHKYFEKQMIIKNGEYESMLADRPVNSAMKRLCGQYMR